MQQDTFVKERTALAVQPEQGEDTIDLLELFMGLLAHWTLIAATAVVGAVLMALYTFFLVTPMYKATATIYVVSRNDSVLNFSDLQVGSELTSDYIKVFEMWEVHEKVISNLDLDVASRGLGDVYKRQVQPQQGQEHPDGLCGGLCAGLRRGGAADHAG